MKQSKNTLGLLGAAVVGSLLLGNTAFAVEPMSHGYQLAAAKTDAEGKCGGSEKAGKAEGKCGGEAKAGKAEGKCGEGKCGASEKQADKAKS